MQAVWCLLYKSSMVSRVCCTSERRDKSKVKVNKQSVEEMIWHVRQ